MVGGEEVILASQTSLRVYVGQFFRTMRSFRDILIHLVEITPCSYLYIHKKHS